MKNKQQTLLRLTALVAWTALLLQYGLMMARGGQSLAELHIRFFSYFTIDSNLLVAVATGIVGFFPQTRWGQWAQRPATLTALTMYILVVGLIYNAILRPLFPVQGWDALANELLHVVTPLMMALVWMATPRGTLRLSQLPYALIYPLCYCLLVLWRGSWSGFYPYPFLNVERLGLERVIVNSLGVTLLFVVLAFLFLGIDRWAAPKQNHK